MREKELIGYLALLLTEGIGPIKFKKIVEDFGNPLEVFEKNFDVLAKFTHHPLPSKDELLSRAEKELEISIRNQIKIIHYKMDDFPKKLNNYDDSPPVLFVKGELTTLENLSIAVVGTRKPTYYGKKITRWFVEKFVESNITIISGGARGIDTIAHQTAVEMKSPTVCIMGSGFRYLYPPENKKLFERIIETGGALVSEFPFHTKPNKENFPRRNRIISALSHGVVVVEAPKISGALITSKWASEQGIDVFAVPGPVDSPSSYGTNWLIKHGAIPVTEPEDILEFLGIEIKRMKKELPLLNQEEERVYKLIGHEPIHIDKLAFELGTQPYQIVHILLNLELKGLIQELPGKFFLRTANF